MITCPAARASGVVSLLVISGLFLNCGTGPRSTPQLGGTPLKLTQITLAPTTLALTKGATLQFTATGVYEHGVIRDISVSATWQTSLPAIAVVDSQGNVTGVGVGASQVSATYQGLTASAPVNVAPPVLLGITVSPNPSSVPVGESEQFTAVGSFSDGSLLDLTQSAAWSSSGPAIASVSPAAAAVANAIGTTSISATSGAVTGFASLTVTPPVVTALNISPTALSVVLGGSRQFRVVATLSDGTTQDMTGTAAWSLIQPRIASMPRGGFITAMRAGSTTILAQANGLTASAALTVTPLMAVNYFSRAGALSSGVDGTIQLVNPGLTSGDLCAMVYVFDRNQELNECCGCSVSDSGLRTLSLLNDLTANPLTGKSPTTGSIKVVASDPAQNPLCDASSLAPAGELLGWETHPQGSGDAVQVTETSFDVVPLSAVEAAVLVNECSFVEQLGSGKGICSCGFGN
jgi:hypothetical protein